MNMGVGGNNNNNNNNNSGPWSYNNNSIQFIYLRAWQQPDKANYSQALKQQYRIKYDILKSTNDLQIKN
jgi:hypothetical protein